MSAVIQARGIVKRYGSTTALSGATVTIGPGVTGLLGSNGAGKTTLLGLLLGLHRPDAGELRVLGLDPSEAGPDVRARVGYAPEHHSLPPDMSAYDLVRHLAEIHGLPRREAIDRASDVLWLVGLGEERLRPVGTMSTGQRQRVKLAAALGHDPTLLLLDEPTDGLDPTQRDAMLALIRRVGHEFGIDIVLSSHLLEEVERICDEVVILAGGEVAAAGPLDELRGAGSGVVVEVQDGAEALVAALTARGFEAVAVDARVEVAPNALGEDALYDAVRDAVAEAEVQLRRLRARRATLEDVFLGLDRVPAAVALAASPLAAPLAGGPDGASPIP
ncbi:MAG: ATP-binding cassette domain-containing protein [Acidimicrobiia bacterium]|nr:ATP-binding cassette domain-containing protein [Acidimicrobiia bacterium]